MGEGARQSGHGKHLSSPYAPADCAASRWIRALARGLSWVQQQPETIPGPEPEWLRLGLAIALLDLPRGLLNTARHGDAFDEVSGRILVLHGETRLMELQWWAALEVARASVELPATKRSALAFNLHGLVTELGWLDAMGDALTRFGDGSDARAALDDAERTAVRQLGLDEGVRRGRVPVLELPYPEIYRLARILGELRALHLLEADGITERLDRELEPTLERVQLRRFLPEIEGLDRPGPALWEAIDAFFEVAVGGLSEAVYRAAHDHCVIAEVGFRGLTFRRAVGGLQRVARRFRSAALARELDALAEETDGADTSSLPPPVGLADRVGRWLEEQLPTDGSSELEHARVLAWAWRFRGHHVPVDAARIEQFLAQFPGELRWVGEGLLDAVQFLTRDQIAASLAFLLRSYGLASQPGTVLVRLGEDGFGEDLRRQGIRLPTRPLAECTDAATLVLCDDALITGARLEQTLGPALDELSEAQRRALSERSWVIAVGVGSLVGVEHIGSWLESELGRAPRIVVGRDLRILSGLGLEELDAGTLYDEQTGALTQASAQLAEPLFSIHEPLWAGRDPQVAREVVTEIGQSLLGSLPDTADWTQARLRGTALGAGGLQGRLVFGHRTPETTVTCLWCPGTWRGHVWRPLFEQPEEAT